MYYTEKTTLGREIRLNIEFYGNTIGICIPGETDQKMMNLYGYYAIPGYNGYELMLGLSVDHTFSDLEPSDIGPLSCKVRSTKNFRKYPAGYTIKYTRKNDKWFELSNNNNIRVRLSLAEVLETICRSKHILLETPAYFTNVGSRNRIKTIPPRQKDPAFTEKNKTLKLNALLKG